MSNTNTRHEDVLAAVSAGAQKIKEALEALMQAAQRKEQAASDQGAQPQTGGADNQPYSPSDEDTQLYQRYYEAYREHGVDHDTAQAAAADATVGLDAQNSSHIQEAHAQVIANQQQAQTYRTAVTTEASPDSSESEKQAANAQRQDIEQNLGIQNQPVEQKVQTINQLDPPTEDPTQEIEEERPPATTTPPDAKEKYRRNLQQSYEEHGARPETAEAASHEVVNKEVGAKDGPAVKQVHQEIKQHQVLKTLYQGVYEKSGVSPELASQAADQMARGNGANRSEVVRQAHDQALGNVSQAQNVSPDQAPQAVEKPESNRSPEASQQATPSPSQKPTPHPNPEKSPTAPRPILRNEKSQPSPQSTTTPETSKSLWQQHSPNEEGKQLKADIDYDNDTALNDSHFAYNALSAGAQPEAIKAALLSNSPEANAMSEKEASSYADRVISRANQELSPQQTSAPSVPSTATTSQTSQVGKAAKATERPSADSTKPDAPTDNTDSQAKQPQPTTSTQPAPPKLTSQQLYNRYSESKGNGVFAAVSKRNARANDLAVAQKALIAGHSFDAVKAAIAENSPHAQTLEHKTDYGKRTVDKVRKTEAYQKVAPSVIWNQFQSGQGQPRSDNQIARSAIDAGYEHKYIAQAIAQNSPVAETASNPDNYGQGIVQAEIKTIEKEKTNSQPAKQTGKEKAASAKQKNQRASQKKTTQKKRKSKQKSQKKNQGMEL